MIDITKIDKNFAVPTKVEREHLCYFDIEEQPFRIYGVKKEGGKFRRMPEKIAAKVNEGVYQLHTNTAGGRVRFVTDSPFVAIHAVMDYVHSSQKMAATAGAGFDMYFREIGTEWSGAERYAGTFIPPEGAAGGYESILDLAGQKERLVTVNFPLYSNLTKLYIGLKEGSSLKEAPNYTYEIPMVCYGSSITQGGCASRPGNCYQNFLTRQFDCNHWNLGFSGSAMGEDTIADWISQLRMSVFIYDYDYNALTKEQLAETHEKMFLTVRQAQPDLPIIIMSRPKYDLSDYEKLRLEIIRATYENARTRGDRNVYLIEGHELMAIVKDNGTVDGCHPSDVGFFSMANAIAPVLGKILAGLVKR